MAVEGKITVGFSVTEIGADAWDVLKKFNITTVADRKFYSVVQQAVADTAEALSVGDLGTVEAIIVHAITNDVDIDPNYVSVFKAGNTVQVGEWAIFKPAGTLYFKNNDSAVQVTFEYWLIGTLA